MRLTEEILESGISRNGSWSNKQLKLFGVKVPLRSGWKDRIVGRFFPESTINKFLELKDAHLPDEKYECDTFRCPHCRKKINIFK